MTTIHRLHTTEDFRKLFDPQEYCETYKNNRNEYMKYMKLYYRFKKHGNIDEPYTKNGGVTLCAYSYSIRST